MDDLERQQEEEGMAASGEDKPGLVTPDGDHPPAPSSEREAMEQAAMACFQMPLAKASPAFRATYEAAWEAAWKEATTLAAIAHSRTGDDGSLDQALTMANGLGGEVVALREALQEIATRIEGKHERGDASPSEKALWQITQQALAASPSTAAEPPGEEEVERAAIAIMKDDVLRPRTDSGLGGLRPMTWKELNEDERQAYRATARAALTAASRAPQGGEE